MKNGKTIIGVEDAVAAADRAREAQSSAPRARKEAAGRLAIALQAQHRRLVEAEIENDKDATFAAAMALAANMNENIEFIVWALKVVGGVSTMPPERRR